MYFLGLDLGQSRDHTALAVVERWDRPVAFGGTAFGGIHVRHLERLPLGTPYPAVVDRVRAIVRNGALRGNVSVAIDATGVGAPVLDQLRAARLGCSLVGVTMTGGALAHAASNSSSADTGGVPRWNVPKRDLLTGLQVLLERDELRLAKTMDEVDTLLRELMDVRVTLNAGGRERMGADRSGEHDDLVIALSLACWLAKRQRNPAGQGRLPG